MGGRKPRQKGDRVERSVLAAHAKLGIHGQRIPCSGSAGGEFAGDLVLYPPLVGKIIGEVKSRRKGRGWATMRNWLENRDILFLHENLKRPLVVIQWALWERILGKLYLAHIRSLAGEVLQMDDELEPGEDQSRAVQADRGGHRNDGSGPDDLYTDTVPAVGIGWSECMVDTSVRGR